jgi:succinyl-diaminopimelate desuccinylase
MDVISLTRKLLSFNTVNPPGNEEEIAKFVGGLLAGHGFKIEYPVFEVNRLHLIAEKGLSSKRPPIVLSGHFDTVPLGKKSWSFDPFTGEVDNGKILGRGSSDMKGGLAAMILASIGAFIETTPAGGIRLIFSAGEELGCLGISKLVRENRRLGEASAIIVGEPTANLPVTGHKGALYLKAVTSGKTAHSSMPELGVNAIYKAAGAIMKIRDFDFEAEHDPLLGYPTLNVGMIIGGMNINSVPDHAEFTIDIRSTTKVDHSKILKTLTEKIGNEAAIETLVDLKPVFTPENDPFVQMVYGICKVESLGDGLPKALPYLTDGSVLQKFYKDAPTVILGPGQPEMAHQTDEFCNIDKLESAVNIYKNIILKWR